MDEMKKYIKKSISFSNVHNNWKKEKQIISHKEIYKDNINKPLNKSLVRKLYINKSKPVTVYEKINENINKIRDLNNKTMGTIKKNIKIIDNELFYKKLNHNNIKNYKSFKNNISKKIEIRSFNKAPSYIKIINDSKCSNINITTNKNISSFTVTEGFNTDKNNNHQKLSITSYLSPVKIKNLNKNNTTNYKSYSTDYLRNSKNLSHQRSFLIDEQILRSHAYKIFNISPILMGKSYFIKDSQFQLNCIMNKIKLILDNIEYFKVNFKNNKSFNKAFNNMINKKKAEFNLVIEEICVLLLKLIPLLLKNFNVIMDKLLFIGCPDRLKESLKNPNNERECLNMNVSFLNKIVDYFQGCMELYKVIQIKIPKFKYDINEFTMINIYLDLARYNSSRIICISNTSIKKMNQDQEFINKLDFKYKEKKEEKNKENTLERYHKRHKKIIMDDTIKLNRINHVLDLKTKINYYSYSCKSMNIEDKIKKKLFNEKGIYPGYLLNSHLIKSMMKYFKKNIKTQIIAQQVMDKYKSMENINTK